MCKIKYGGGGFWAFNLACGRTLAKPGFTHNIVGYHVIIRKHVKIINATINLTTLATRLLGKPTWQFQAIQETRKHARKNLSRRDISGVIGPLAEGAEVSDDGGLQTTSLPDV